MASGTGSGRRLHSMNWRNSFTIGHGRANRRMLSTFFGSILCDEDGDLDQVAVNAPVESNDVSSVGVLEFLHVPRHPLANECCLKDLGHDWVPTNLIAGCRQDRRMKDNVLIEGGDRSRKIAGFQRGGEGSLRHGGESSGRAKGELAIAAGAGSHDIPDFASFILPSGAPRWCVGWVERSETHRMCRAAPKHDGFVSLMARLSSRC
jgi:hypothetical protein